MAERAAEHLLIQIREVIGHTGHPGQSALLQCPKTIHEHLQSLGIIHERPLSVGIMVAQAALTAAVLESAGQPAENLHPVVHLLDCHHMIIPNPKKRPHLHHTPPIRNVPKTMC